MFNFRRDQDKFNNNGGYPSLDVAQPRSLGNMNGNKITPGAQYPTAGIGPYEQAQTQGYAPQTQPAIMNNPYQRNLSRDRYLNENYRNPMRQRMGRIGQRRRRAPIDLRKMQFIQNMMRNRRGYGV